jgi:hypothetical protein
MRQSGTRSRHFPDPGLRIRTARGACAPRRRRCQPERASPGIRTCSRWVADPLEIGVLRVIIVMMRLRWQALRPYRLVKFSCPGFPKLVCRKARSGNAARLNSVFNGTGQVMGRHTVTAARLPSGLRRKLCAAKLCIVALSTKAAN